MKKETICIVGLGNPGKKYEKTRHNIGFRIVDSFFKKYNPEKNWSFEQKHNAEIATISSNEKKILLVKPQTFMNRSGESINSLLQYHKLSPENNILIVHDEIDIPFEKIRFSKDSSPAGHNGIKSIISSLGTQNFARLRFGIQNNELQKNLPTENFVLKDFSSEEENSLPSLVKLSIEAIETFIEKNFTETANKYNQKD